MKHRTTAVLLLLLAALLTACGSRQPVTADASSAAGTDALFANDACSYTLKDAFRRNDEYVWQVLLTNRTASELVFSMDRVYVDDYLADPYFAVAVAAGESSEVEVSWQTTERTAWSPDRVSRVDFRLSAYLPDAADAPVAETELTVYPLGEDAYRPAERQSLSTDRVLLETEETAVVLTAWVREDTRCGLELYMENRTDRAVTYTLENLHLNGQSFESARLLSLDGGKRGDAAVYWADSELEDHEITTPGEIIFDLTVCGASDNSVLYSERVSVRP